jgi:Spy/CpxP family protein refolding chaperone
MHQAMSSGTAPERMALAQQHMGERQKAMASMSESLTKLYDVLTPKQREVFDQSHRPMGRRG